MVVGMMLLCPLTNLALIGMLPVTVSLAGMRMISVLELLGVLFFESEPHSVSSGLSNKNCSVWLLILEFVILRGLNVVGDARPPSILKHRRTFKGWAMVLVHV